MSRGFVNGFFAVRLPIRRHAVLRYGALPLTYLMYAPRPRALRALPDNKYPALIRLLQKKKNAPIRHSRRSCLSFPPKAGIDEQCSEAEKIAGSDFSRA